MKYLLAILVGIGWLGLGSTAKAETLRELASCHDGLGDIWGEKEARIRMRKLDGAAIKSTQDFARMTGTRDVSLKLVEGGDFSGWDFRNIPLHQVCFMGSELKGANFAGAEGSGTGFIKSDLTGANLQGAVMPRVMFRNAKLDNVNAKGANFHSGHFDGGWFEGGVAGWNLDDATMIGFTFDCGITLDDGCPVYQGGDPISAKGANFTRATLHSFGLYNVQMNGARLDGTIIGPGQLPRLRGAKIEGSLILRGGGENISLSPREIRQLLEANADAEVINSNPSFDCSAERTKVEEEICGEYAEDLRRLDRDVSALYKQAVTIDPKVRASQRAWLKQRNKCNAEEYANDCIRTSYSKRKGELLGLVETTEWLDHGEELLFIDDVLPVPDAFRESDLYKRIALILVGASMTEILVKREDAGLYSIAGYSVGANAHLCSLSGSQLYLDKETGWHIPVTEGAAMPVFRYYDGRLEIYANGRPDYKKWPDGGMFMSCGMRASFGETVQIDTDEATIAKVRASLTERN